MMKNLTVILTFALILAAPAMAANVSHGGCIYTDGFF